MGRKKLICCLAMIICLCNAIAEASAALSHGIENNEVDDDWCANFAANLDPFAEMLKKLSSRVTDAVGALAGQIKE